ncbi:MAG: hypothetical protein PHP96_03575, partial [Candidatus Dojkabacteria bacterium]|nr:hypothetical protein [Candidatus Dojkabacteria bacterium]
MNKNSLVLWLAMLPGIMMLLSACGGNQQKSGTGEGRGDETVTITHTLGSVEAIKNARRVVVLDFSALAN